MAPHSVIRDDPEFGAAAEQSPGTQHSTVSPTTTLPSPHAPTMNNNWYPPNVSQAEQGPDQLGEPDFSDGSGSLFSMYVVRAEEEDRKRTEGWRKDADGVLSFSGRFSIAVAVLLSVTIQDIRPNPQETSAYYLANIFQQLSPLNDTQVSIPSDLRNPVAPFTPLAWAVWVNGFWLMSLLTSLTSSLLAMFVQRWTRRYLRVAYPPYNPYKQARIRAFYAHGVEKLCLPRVAEALPTLPHISFSLFLVGLSILCFNVNSSIFKVVLAWIGLCVIVYAYLTALPFLHKDSPYAVPLSAFLSFLLTDIRSTFFQLAARFYGAYPATIQPHTHSSSTVHLDDDDFSYNMRKTAEQHALQLSPEIDYDLLTQLFLSLRGDDELEEFFERLCVPCGSKAAANAQFGFVQRNEKMLGCELVKWIDRTLSSNLPESVKLRRIIICTKVVEATSLLGPWWMLRRVLLGEWQKFLQCIEFGTFVEHWSIAHPVTYFYARCVAAVTISSVQDHDDLGSSFQVASWTIELYSGSAERYRKEILDASSKALESLGNLDPRRTSPDLQHEFCCVWNQLLDLAQNDNPPHIVHVSRTTLKHIFDLYLRLHEGTDASPTVLSRATGDEDPVLDDPGSYCKCSDARHRPPRPVPELKIEEPALEEAISIPPPTVLSEMVPISPLPATHLPTGSFTPSCTRATSPIPSFSQPTLLNTSHVYSQATSAAPPPYAVSSRPVGQVAPTLPGL